MIPVLVLVVSVFAIFIGGRFYSRFLARNWGESAENVTPAVKLEDGRDYVPTPTPIVFAHHFASIAGAGPIIGPVLAICFGWAPALIWIVLGGILIGAMHDYLAAFMSIRNNGQSMATLARRMLGRGPFIALMLFLILMLGLVTAVFLNNSANALTSMLDFGRMKLPENQSVFRMVEVGGVRKLVIGGVASMSVIFITALAPLVGWLYIKRKISVWKVSLTAIAICILSIAIGLFHPVSFPSTISIGSWSLAGSDIWKILLAVYTLAAAGVPVWIFLQSRDFINVHILYAGIAFLLSALIVSSLRGGMPEPDVSIPPYDGVLGNSKLGPVWPWLFITIACGAVSGFHSLCAGGTTCKQLKSESATRAIGYWGMLLESTLAIVVVCTLMVGTTRGFYLEDVFPAGSDSNPVLGFAFAVGRLGHTAFGLPIAAGAIAGMLLLEGFIITSLDTAVRLNRYLIEEIWQEYPLLKKLLPFIRYYWVNAGIAVALMLWFSFSGGIRQLWGIFATGNQLLASFVLGLGAIWLIRNGRRAWYVITPACFMIVTTLTSLVLLFIKFKPGTSADGTIHGNVTLFTADIVLLALTAYLVIAGVRELLQLSYGKNVPVINPNLVREE